MSPRCLTSGSQYTDFISFSICWSKSCRNLCILKQGKPLSECTEPTPRANRAALILPEPPAARTHQRRGAANSNRTAAGSNSRATTRINQRSTSWSLAPSRVARYRTGPKSASTFARSPSAVAFSTLREASALASLVRWATRFAFLRRV